MSAVAAAVTLLFDYLMPLGVAAAVPYALLVLLSLWLPGRWTPLLFASIGTALTAIGFLLSSPPAANDATWPVYANRMLALVMIWVTAALCHRQRRTMASLQELQSELFRIARITELGAMTSTIAHETNQPLTAVSTYLYTLKRLLEPGRTVPETAQHALDRALAQTDRANEVIRRIREMSANDDSERAPEPINEIVRDAIDIALLGTRRLGIRLQLALDETLPRSHVNRTQIQQVVLNLIRNAADALAEIEPDRRALTVTSRPAPEGGALIEIVDTGPGLDDEIRRNLFRPFQTTKPEGIGIGLSICRSIIEAHGGRIWAEPNTHPDGGTRFAFVLPEIR